MNSVGRFKPRRDLHTERVRNDDELTEEMLRLLSSAVEQTSEGIAVTDLEGNLLFVNSAFAVLHGYTPGEVIGCHLSVFHTSDQMPQVEVACQQVQETGEFSGEIWHVRRDGTVFPTLMRNSLLRDQAGKPTGMIGTLRDISARKRAEEALQEHAAALEARTEELDAFAHTVAHDLKHPLCMLISYVEFLQEHGATVSDEERDYYLERMAQTGRRMSNIIDELLLLAGVRKKKVRVRSLDMASVVAKALERLDYMIAEHQAEIAMPPTWPAVLGYGPWVEEVWVNYLSNAIQYGGRPPRVELGAATQADGQVRFWARDNGPGLTPEEQSRLFTPLRRLDQIRARGHGLGLSIVRRIVEQLGGQVGVESAFGRGSVFHFTLPGVAG